MNTPPRRLLLAFLFVGPLVCWFLLAVSAVHAAPDRTPAAPQTQSAPPPPAPPATEDVPEPDDPEQGGAGGEHVRQEAESEAGELRRAAEEARAAALEARRADAVWEEVFQQNENALRSVEIKAESLSRQLGGVIRPLRAGLPEMAESARRLIALHETQSGEPLMLETIRRRGESLAARLRLQMRPLTEAGNLIADLSATIEQTKRAIEDASAPAAGTSERIADIETRLSSMANRLNRPLRRASRLLERLDGMLAASLAVLPRAWIDYYLAVPNRFFDPAAWQNMGERFGKTMQDMALRLSVEIPRSVAAWQSFFLRALNLLLLGGAALFFVGLRLRRHPARLGDDPDQRRRGIIRSLAWVLGGLAVLSAAISSRSEIYRALLVGGSLIAMWGEVSFAWEMRCLTMNRRAGASPLRPLYALPAAGIALSFPDLPSAVLSLGWLAAGLTSLRQGRKTPPDELPAMEKNLLHVHCLALWLSLAVAVFGWARMSILLVVVVDCLLISIQLSMGLMQLVNRSAETGLAAASCGDQARRSLASGLFAAFSAPMVLALVIVGTALWAIAMPGGALLLWHYLGTGVSIGSASFNLLHLLLILSLFYITRAAIATLQSLIDRLASGPGLSSNLIPPMRTGMTYGLWTLFGLFTLNALGFGLENLAMIAGGLSVGIGFGLQNIVSNFLSGLILIFSRTLHEGDIIDVGELQGAVRKINVRATTIETSDNAVIFVPNSEFVSNRLINWTRNGRTVRREVSVGVAYGTDPARIEDLLLEIAARTPNLLAWPQPCVIFANFGSSTLDFVLRFWADISDATAVASDIRKDIARTFAERNIAIAFPQLDVHIVREKGASAFSGGAQTRFSP